MARGKVKNGLRGSWLKHEKKKFKRNTTKTRKAAQRTQLSTFTVLALRNFQLVSLEPFIFFFYRGEGANEMQMLYGGLSVIY